MKTYTKEEVVQKLKQLQGKRTVAEFAASLGMTYAYLNSVYNGAPIGKKLRAFLGLGCETIKTVTYFELNGSKRKMP